jgi:hypothetical protein
LRTPWHVVARAGDALSSAARQLIDDLINVGGEFEFTAAGAALVQRGPR